MMFNLINNWSLGFQSLFFAGIIIAIISLVLGSAVLIKPKISRKSMIYIYAFSTGFLIILGTLGILNGARENLHKSLAGKNLTHLIEYIIIISVLVGGSLIGFSISFFVKHLVLRNSKEVHANHEIHDHDEHIINLNSINNKKNKWTAIFLLTLHKIPAGLTMGILIFSSKNSSIGLATIIAFMIHIIPEILIIYYRQISLGVSKYKSARNTFLLSFIIVPFIFVGAYAGELINSIYWIIPLILVIAGIIIIYTAIVELVPEFIHGDISHRKWVITITMLMLGIILALIILAFHHH